MKVILPRVILGNRGDLASRWGLLYALQTLQNENVTVFAQSIKDIPSLNQDFIPYGKVRNLILSRKSKQAFKQSDIVLWSVGLDLQDDSSLAKLFYMNLVFRRYRLMGLQVMVLFQGAGPLETRVGKLLAKQILSSVNLFVSRDPGTHKLVRSIQPSLNCILGHDAIFLPDLEQELLKQDIKSQHLPKILSQRQRPVVGFNLRQWFHFSSSILPYEFSKKKYLQRSQGHMEHLLRSTVQVIQTLQERCTVILISAYQPGIIPWEDDLYWLSQVKAVFQENPNVILFDSPIGVPTYFHLMSQLDLMIGMRLHSTLIALRFNVPSINISYTLKGRDIMKHLGLENNVIELHDFLNNPDIITKRAMQILNGSNEERVRIDNAVSNAIEQNMNILYKVFNNSGA